MNSRHAYGWVSIVLHWLMAAQIAALFALGAWMVDLTYYDAWYHRAPALHQAIGMLFLALLALRMLWRGANRQPQIEGANRERLAAVIVHRLHYVLMLAVGISGYLIPTAEGRGFDMPPGLHVPALFSLTSAQADINGAVHRYAAWALMLLAGVHTLAALKHHFINRDATLMRMLGISTPRRTT